ncbi:MAG: fibronectin type III domain-containing protein [Lachnospiraceae bacterium]|nr:fibronectin type III domain-containing protein [Lachnospiraceae bacterium]
MKNLFFKQKAKNALALTLTVALSFGLLPDVFFETVNVYAGNGTGGDAYLCLLNDESYDDQTTHTIWKKDGATWIPNAESIPGTSYDKSTNTLTLSNFDGSKQYLEANSMGEDFKIKLEGTNTLHKIYVYGSGHGGSLDITGSGSLELNATKTLHLNDRSAICLRGENSKTRLTVENTASVHAISDEGQPAVMITDSLDDIGIDVKGMLENGEVLSENSVIAKKITANTQDAGIYVYSAYQDLYKDAVGNFYGVLFQTIYSGSGGEIPYYRIYTLDGGEDGAKVTGALTNDNWEAEFEWAKIYCSPNDLWFKNVPDNLTPVLDVSGRKNFTVGLTVSNNENIFANALSEVIFIPTKTADDSGSGSGYCIFPENSVGLINKDSSFSLYYYPKDTESVLNVTANISYKSGTDTHTQNITLKKDGPGYKYQANISEILKNVTHIDSVDIYANNTKVFSKIINKNLSSELAIKFSGDGCSDDTHTKTLIIKSGDKEIFNKSLGKAKLSDITVNTLPIDLSLTAELMITINGGQTLLGKAEDVITKSGEKTDVGITVSSVPLTFSPKITVTSRNHSGRSRLFCTTLRPIDYSITWYKDEEGGEPLGKGASFTNTAGDMSEYLYADIELLNTYALQYEATNRYKVKFGNETTIDIPAIATTKKLTINLKDSNGNTKNDVPLLIEKTKNGYSSSETIISGHQDSYQYPLNAGVSIKMAYPAYQFEEGQNTSLECTDNEIKELVIVPRKGLINSNYHVRSATIKTSDGENVPFEINDSLILLDSDSVTQGQKLNVRLESGNKGTFKNPSMYYDGQITLDGENISTSIPDDWQYYGEVTAAIKGGTDKSQGLFYGLLYDSKGRLLDDLKTLSHTKDETTIIFMGSLYEDNYTFLIADKDAVNAIGKLSVQNLNDAKTNIESKGLNLYTETDFSVKDGNSTNIECQFPSGDYDDGTVKLDESQITISATPEKVSYHALVNLNNTSSKQVSVRVITNQTFKSDYTNLPIFINDIFTINGKKVRAGAEQKGFYGCVNYNWAPAGNTGNYTIYTFIIDDINKYGGFPLEIKWSAARTQKGTLLADGYVSADRSGADNTQYNSTAHFFGRDECISPAITCYVPDQISDSEFKVYGYAPLNSKVTLSLDGKDVKIVNAAGINGYFCETLTLNNPVGRQRHYVSARAEYNETTLYSNRMTTTYCASNQTLNKIEITDMNENYHTCWTDGKGTEGGYYYYSETVPMKYRLSFDNINTGDDLSEVTVHIPRTDDIISLPCTFKEVKNGVGIWESESYLFGVAPPHGAWVSFKSGLSVVQITPEDKNNYKIISAEKTEMNKTLVNAVGTDENDEKRNSGIGSQFTKELAKVGISDVKLNADGELQEALVNCSATEYFGSDFDYDIVVNSSKSSGNAATKKNQFDALSYPEDVSAIFANSDVTQVYDETTKTLYLEPDELMPYIAYHAGSGTDESPFIVECVIKHIGNDGTYVYNHIEMSLCDYKQEMVDGINDEVTSLTYHYKDGKESDLLNLSESTRMFSYSGDKTDSNASYMSANLAYKQNEVRAFWGMFTSNIYDAATGTNVKTNVSANSASTELTKVRKNVLKRGFKKLAGTKGFSPKDDPNPCAALTKEQEKIFSSPESSYAALLIMVYNDNKGPAGSNDAALYMESNNLGINKLALICGFLTTEDFCREMNDLLSKASLGAGLVNNGLSASGLTKTFREKIVSDFQGDALGKFLAEIGVSNHKALDKATDIIYQSLLQAEKDGVKVNWNNFPFSDKYPDPRKKQEQDENSAGGGGGGNTGQSGEEPGDNPGDNPGGGTGDNPGDNPGGGTGDNPGDNSGGGTGDNPGDNSGGPSNSGGGTTPSNNGGSSSGGTGYTGEPIPDSPTAAKDPSGYVYEAVASNRIKDVTAILYEVDTESGTKYKWNGSETGQLNPYKTDEYGLYEWGVDDGAYQVTFEKDGYEYYSTANHPEDGIDTQMIESNGEYYMPVPPQQIDVNVGLISTESPCINTSDIKVIADDGIDITFSQYMDVSTLTPDKLSVTNLSDGKTYKIDSKSITYKDAQSDPKDENKQYATTLHISLPQLKNNDEVVIEVSCNVNNYAGRSLAESFSVDTKAVGGGNPSGGNPSGGNPSGGNPSGGNPSGGNSSGSNSSGSNSSDSSTTSANNVADDKVSAPTITTLMKGYKSFTATWKTAPDITEYELQYATKKNFKDAKVKICKAKKSATSIKIKKLKGNKKYFVRIRAIKTTNGKKYYSDWSKVKTVKTTNVKVNKPKIKSVKTGNNSLHVTWNKDKDIINYELQYATNKNFKGKKTKSVTAKKATITITETKLKKNKKYFVRIRAIKVVKGKKYYSEWSKVKNIKIK